MAVIEALTADNPFAKSLQIQLIEWTGEETIATMVVKDEYLNING